MKSMSRAGSTSRRAVSSSPKHKPGLSVTRGEDTSPLCRCSLVGLVAFDTNDNVALSFLNTPWLDGAAVQATAMIYTALGVRLGSGSTRPDPRSLPRLACCAV